MRGKNGGRKEIEEGVREREGLGAWVLCKGVECRLERKRIGLFLALTH